MAVHMLLAAVHLPPAVTVPTALVISALLVWYWLQLGRDGVPASRRKIRRFSLAVILLSMPMLVRALSFVDSAVDKKPYVIAWTSVTFMVLLVITTALMDAINNLRLHQHQRHDAIAQAATDLAGAIRERRQQERASHASPAADVNGKPAPETGA